MKFKQIAIENFRPYFGKQTLPFSTSSDKPVTIIEAPNNWGKTSVYEAVKWCLYDVWPVFDDRDNSINTEAIDNYTTSSTPFDVSVTIDFEHEKDNYRLWRSFTYSDEVNVKNPDSKLYLSGVTKRGDNIKLDHILDYQLFIQNLLPQEVSKYFIVDGDDFKAFINPTGSKTKEAIEQLLNLKIFDRVRQHLNTLEKEFTGALAKKSGSKDVKALGVQVEKADDALVKLRKEEKELKGKRDLSYSQYKKYDKQLQKATLSSGKIDKIETLEKNNKVIEKQKLLLINECSKRLSSFHTFMLKKHFNDIYDKLSAARKPLDISPYDKVLLKDIVKLCDKNGHVDCLCGSGIKKDDTNYKSIKEKLDTLDGISNKNEVLELQTQLKEIILNIGKQKKEIKDYEVGILKADQLLEKNNGVLKKLREEVDVNVGQNAASLASATKQAFDSYEKLKLNHAVLEETIRNRNDRIEIDRKELAKSLNVDERTKKLGMKADLVAKAYNAVENNYETYRLKKKKELQKTVQKYLFKLLTAEGLFKSFKIDDDYEYDILDHRGESWKRRLSNGQKKVLGVSFVAGLKNVANEDAPYIIDSPLNALDKEHQKNYAKMLPDLSSQLILFVTDLELADATSTLLRPKVGKAMRIDWKIADGNYNRSTFVKGNA